MTDPIKFAPAKVIEDWLVMCASSDELVSNFNRLYGANLTFDAPYRSPIEMAVDRACGFKPEPKNDPEEMEAFVKFCIDALRPLLAQKIAEFDGVRQ